MFYIYFDGHGSAKVYDTDDNSLETLPESIVRSFLSGSNLQYHELPSPFKVVTDGDYYMIYCNDIGRRQVIKAFLHCKGVFAVKSMSVRYVGDISVRLKSFPLGCKVIFTVIKNGKKYESTREYNYDLAPVDMTDFRLVTR